MNKFKIYANSEYLKHTIQGYFHTDYVRYGNPGNPDYLNDLKNTFNSYPKEKLHNAATKLYNALKEDLSNFDREFTVCVIPRSKAQNSYSLEQLFFKGVVKMLIEELGFNDGSDYIIRHTDTKTTHLAHSKRGAEYAGDGSMPYPGITKDTCNISKDVKGKYILLIDDIYTKSVNIDEDAIQALLDNGAKSVIFYAIGKTK